MFRQSGRRITRNKLLRRSVNAAFAVVVLVQPGCMRGCSAPTTGRSARIEPPSVVVELTDANFQREVIESQQPVLVDFWAPWCQPCREMAPGIEQLALKFEGKAKIGKLNIDEHAETASACEVSSIPAVLFFQHGNVIKRRLGKQSQRDMAHLLNAMTLPPTTGIRPEHVRRNEHVVAEGQSTGQPSQ